MTPSRLSFVAYAAGTLTPGGGLAVNDAQGRGLSLSTRLFVVFAATYAILLVVAGLGQITDPFIHYDDYPGLLLLKEGYYDKTLSEGRWFNYLWLFRGVITPAWFNFQLYLLGWALLSAGAALNVFRSADLRYPLLLSALMVLSPQAALVAGWFNMFIPGLWLMAAYTVTALFVSPRTGRWLLIPFVPLAIQAYTPWPFLMLAVCLMREDRDRSLAELARLIATFVAAFALGILVIFTINYAVHGVFGIALAEWRDPNPAGDLAGYVENLPKLVESFRWSFFMTGYGRPILSVMVLLGVAASLVVLWRRDRIEVASILIGIASGLSLLALHTLQEGVQFPFRSTGFVWFMFAVAMTRAAWLLRERAVPLALIVMLAVVGAALVRNHHQSYADWQVETRRIAEMIPGEVKRAYVYRLHLFADGYETSRAQFPRDFSFRLELLGGLTARMCSEVPDACPGVTPPFDADAPDDEVLVAIEGDTAFIRLPSLE